MDKRFTNVPPTLSRYRIPARLLADSAASLRETGKGVKEAVALWQGRVLSESVAEVTRLIVPRQVTGPLHFNVPLQERLRILREVAPTGEFILIQLHTHPAEAYHSEADDTMAITKHTGAVSIVIPNFARGWAGDLADTSVHRHLGGAKWEQLSAPEVRSLFEVVP